MTKQCFRVKCVKNIVTMDTTSLRWFFDEDPVIIVIGQSGSGKATVSEFLKNLHGKLYRKKELMYLETGGLFREETPKMLKFNQERLKEIQDSGARQSWVIAVSLWVHEFLYGYKEGPIIIDGSPRSTEEAMAIINVFRSYAKREIVVFYLHVSDAEADRRMILRNKELEKSGKPVREDTATSEVRKKKLAYFYTDVVPAIQYLKDQRCIMYKINGQQSKRAVTNAVVSRMMQYVSKLTKA